MDKKDRDEAVAEEACDYADIAFASELASKEDFYGLSRESYEAGSLSRAHTEWVVRRAVEMASDQCIAYLKKEGLRVSVTPDIDQLLSEILKELEIG